ncbi:carboxypeptidase regulatory-like domain-containing protein [bacterium]|nr:carboxypeptidase regulatory-like domain-containing protein [bacterium]
MQNQYAYVADNIYFDIFDCSDALLDPGPANVFGVVTDSINAHPIPNATVRFNLNETVTDENGEYSLVDLEFGEYNIRVSANGYQDFIQNGVYIWPGDNFLDFDLRYSDSLNINMLCLLDTPDNSHAVAFSDSYAFIASEEAGLVVVDVSDPENATVISTFDTPDWANGIDVVDGYAYVADAESGLRIIDVTDPENPAEIGVYNTPGYCHDVIVIDNIAYVADRFGGLRVLDVSDPAHPVQIGVYNTNDMAHSIDYSDGYVYIGSIYSRIHIINVSDPANPQQVSSINMNRTDDITVSQGFLYVAARSDGLVIFDVTDPANPREMGNYDASGSVSGVEYVDGYAFLTASWAGGFHVVNVFNPENPYQTGYYDTPAQAFDVVVEDNLAYVADYHSFQIYDCTEATPEILPASVSGRVSDSGTDQGIVHAEVRFGNRSAYTDLDGNYQLHDLGSVNYDVRITATGYRGFTQENFQVLEGENEFNAVLILDDSLNVNRISILESPQVARNVFGTSEHLFIADSIDGLRIFDISDPVNPNQIGVTETITGAWDVEFINITTFALSSSDGIHIIDPQIRMSPVEVGFIETAGDAYGIESMDHFLLVASGTDGLLIIDVADRNNPVVVGSIETTGFAWDVSVQGNTALIADGADGGVRLINIENPADPVEIGFIVTEGSALGIVVDDDLAYVADGIAGLKIIDMSNVEMPAIIASYAVPGISTNVFLENGVLYLASQFAGLRIIDIEDPENLHESGYYTTEGNALAVAAREEFAYVAAGEFLEIYDCSSALGWNPVQNRTDLVPPSTIALEPAYPNPFNPSITVPFTLPEKMDVRLRLYNIIGQQVAELNQGVLDRGHHELVFEAVNQTSGVYFIVLEAGEHQAMQKVILLK